MAKVLYVRHGQTESNVLGVLSDSTDETQLTDTGRQQAKELGQELKGTQIDRIICSPKARAYDTAVIIAKEIGFDPNDIQKESRITERDTGTLGGTPLKDVTAEMVAYAEGSEDPNMFAKRVKDALLEFNEYPGTTLVVAHGGTAKMIDILKSGENPANFFDVPKLKNARVMELDLTWLSSDK
ncbi:MAG: histidine phosphatase family protein [Patescibacteria group bacterium]